MADEVLRSRAGAVLTITFNRPDVYNAFNRDLHAALAEALEDAADPEVRAVVITGAGRGFCSGQDLKEFSDLPDGGIRSALEDTYHPNIRAIRGLEKPVVAAVNGACAGAGVSLACACDVRIASSAASFVPGFIGIGLVPDSGGSWFVHRLLGFARAFEWMVSNRRLAPEEALEWGLVSEVVEAEQFESRVAELAEWYAALPTRGVAMTKQLFEHAYGASLEEQLELEAQLQQAATGTEDFAEGVQAFLEKRPPAFPGPVILDLLGEARRRLDAGDPSSALRLAERALEAAGTSRSPKALASAAHLVGECLYVTGDVGGARRALDQALAVTQTLGDSEALGADLNLWGVLEITEGRSEDAISLLRRSYELREEALGPEHPDTIESLNNLAVAYWRVGAEDEAIALHEDGLGRCERALGEDHRRTAETLNALAVKLASRPESQARAHELYERGLVAAEAALGPDADLVARLLTNVAAARIDNGDHQSARPLLERSLELHERHFGRDSRWTAYVLSNLGELAWHEGRFDDARRVFERAFVIRVYELGPTEPETLESAVGLLNTLTEVAGEPRPVEQLDELFSGEAADEATALYLPLLAFHPELEEGFPGGGKPDPATAAEQLRRIADRIATRTAPDAAQAEAIGRADVLVAQADASYLEGDLDSAAALLREAVALLETARGATDTSLVEPLQRLKLVLRLAGTESEVLPILRRIAAILADAYGEVHPLAIRALGEVYWQERRDYGPAGGRESAARMESLVQQALGEQSVVGRAVRKVIAAAREAGAGVEPEDPPLSVRRERILAEADPLVDELPHDLDATPWPSLDHAYGPAIDTPRHVRLLLAMDERVRADALDLLGDSGPQRGVRLLGDRAGRPARAAARRRGSRSGTGPADRLSHRGGGGRP